VQLPAVPFVVTAPAEALPVAVVVVVLVELLPKHPLMPIADMTIMTSRSKYLFMLALRYILLFSIGVERRS
jgi:hypothetical protein